jgi:hypothetical protein
MKAHQRILCLSVLVAVLSACSNSNDSKAAKDEITISPQATVAKNSEIPSKLEKNEPAVEQFIAQERDVFTMAYGKFKVISCLNNSLDERENSEFCEYSKVWIYSAVPNTVPATTFISLMRPTVEGGIDFASMAYQLPDDSSILKYEETDQFASMNFDYTGYQTEMSSTTRIEKISDSEFKLILKNRNWKESSPASNYDYDFELMLVRESN